MRRQVLPSETETAERQASAWAPWVSINVGLYLNIYLAHTHTQTHTHTHTHTQKLTHTHPRPPARYLCNDDSLIVIFAS